MALSTIGAISAVAGIAAAGITVAKALDNLIRDIQDAPVTLIVLRNQVNAFNNALQNLEEVESISKLRIANIDRFSQQREDTIAGGYIIIRELENDIEDIRAVHRSQFRHRNGRALELSLKEKLTKKWNDAHIDKWSKALHRQVSILTLLLER